MRRFVTPLHRRRVRHLRSMYARPAPRGRAEIWPDHDDGYSAGSHTVVDDPREPIITETGLLDARGVPLMRVIFPVKVAMGFATPGRGVEVADTVAALLPADHISVTDRPGSGTAYVDLSEVEGDEGPCDCDACKEASRGQD